MTTVQKETQKRGRNPVGRFDHNIKPLIHEWERDPVLNCNRKTEREFARSTRRTCGPLSFPLAHSRVQSPADCTRDRIRESNVFRALRTLDGFPHSHSFIYSTTICVFIRRTYIIVATCWVARSCFALSFCLRTSVCVRIIIKATVAEGNSFLVYFDLDGDTSRRRSWSGDGERSHL